MNYKLTKRDVWLFIFAVAALCLHTVLFRMVYPESAIQMDLTKQDVQSRGEQLVREFGFDTEGMRSKIDLIRNADLTSMGQPISKVKVKSERARIIFH